MQCSRTLRGAGGGALIPKGECFLQIKIGKQTVGHRVVIINNLNHDYIVGAAIQRSYHIATGFSITGRHFLSVNGQIVVQSIPTPTIEPVIKNKDKINLNPYSITVDSVKTPPNIDTSEVYELNHKFLLPSSMIPINVVHKFDNKVPCELKIPILNTNNNIANITKNTALSLRPVEKVTIFSLDWDTLPQTRQLAVEEVLDHQKSKEQVHNLLPKCHRLTCSWKLIRPVNKSAHPMQMFLKRH